MPFDATPPKPSVSDTTIETLLAARAIIADRACWGQHALFHTNKDGGVQYCLLGALEATVCRRLGGIPLASLIAIEGPIRALCYELDPHVSLARHLLSHFNDTHNHADVLRLIDRTVARLRSQLA